MPAPANERDPEPWLFKLRMRLHFAFAALTSPHYVIAWSPRSSKGDRIGFVGLDHKLIHQAQRAADFAAVRLVQEQEIKTMMGDGDA